MNQPGISGANVKQESINDTIANLFNVVAEIKNKVIESMPTDEGLEKTPRQMHKLGNINSDLLRLNKQLEEILKAVNIL